MLLHLLFQGSPLASSRNRLEAKASLGAMRTSPLPLVSCMVQEPDLSNNGRAIF